MKRTAIAHAPIANIKNVAHDAERRSLLLDRRSKGYAVVCSCRSTSTGQPGLMSPVSTFRERMRCFLVVPPSGVIIALKKSARDARSTIGVPMIPMGSKSLQTRSSAEQDRPRCAAR